MPIAVLSLLKDQVGRLGLAANSGRLSTEPVVTEWPQDQASVGQAAETGLPVLVSETADDSVEALLLHWRSVIRG